MKKSQNSCCVVRADSLIATCIKMTFQALTSAGMNMTAFWDIAPCSLVHESRVSSGSIVSGYGLDDRAIGVRSPTGAKDFSSILCVQTGSETHPASCTMGTGGKSAAGA
jgi:hypothetical protein